MLIGEFAKVGVTDLQHEDTRKRISTSSSQLFPSVLFLHGHLCLVNAVMEETDIRATIGEMQKLFQQGANLQ